MFDYKSKLPMFIAGGAPSDDTLKHYNAEIDNFLNWCKGNAYPPLNLTEEDALQYLQYLNAKNYAPASINLKLAAAKTFYHVAQKLHYIQNNPFAEVKSKKPSYDDADFDFLTVEELSDICQNILERQDISAKRDLSIVMLMSVEGLRTVEIHRMNEQDINWNNKSILIHGKGRDSYIYPCQDTLNVLKSYLDERPPAVGDELGKPVFVGFSKSFYACRISRNGIRWAINHILTLAGKKRDGASCHMLRHSCGTNLYEETKDLRLVQETLRQKSPQIAARYAHVSKRREERKTAKISPLGGGLNE